MKTIFGLKALQRRHIRHDSTREATLNGRTLFPRLSTQHRAFSHLRQNTVASSEKWALWNSRFNASARFAAERNLNRWNSARVEELQTMGRPRQPGATYRCFVQRRRRWRHVLRLAIARSMTQHRRHKLDGGDVQRSAIAKRVNKQLMWVTRWEWHLFIRRLAAVKRCPSTRIATGKRRAQQRWADWKSQHALLHYTRCQTLS